MSIPENFSPAVVAISPPLGHEEAVARITEYGNDSFVGLVGMVFASVKQLKLALNELGWNVQTAKKPMMESPNAETIKLIVLSPSGTEYNFIVNEISGTFVRVVNCVCRQVGDAVEEQ